MCGIVGYIGRDEALPILLEGLQRLEYRGYDSSGVAVFDNSHIALEKAPGRIGNLILQLGDRKFDGKAGIAHTRWATHGAPTRENAHPHKDCGGKIFLAHNGIIENYLHLKSELLSEGHVFTSETDTEVLCHLIEKYYRGDFESAVFQTLRRVVGAYGIAVLHADHPGTLIAARNGSPLLLGVGSGEHLVASDVSAVLRRTRQVVYLEDADVAVITSDKHQIKSLKTGLTTRLPQAVDWDIEAAEKHGFPHFMLKEIHEGPDAIRNAMRGRLNLVDGTAKLGGLESVSDRLQEVRHLVIISCGTSYLAGLLGRYILESLTRWSVEVELASEFRYRKMNLRPGTAVLAISQSGETADTLAALREAKRKDTLVLGLVNVVGSSIARETHAGIYNHAGPEISVASTKAFLSQVTVLLLMGLMIGRKQDLAYSDGKLLLEHLERIPSLADAFLRTSARIRAVAEKYAKYNHFLYLGRKYNFPVAMEGALKLKEISYVHAEGYAAGEMKHGPIALIDPDFPCVCLLPKDSSYEKMLSNLQEIKARKAPVIAIASESDQEIAQLADDVIRVPETLELLTPLLMVMPLQLFAYYMAELRGCDIDKPRNLAKSVTVE
jgi:glutamine---fructose-6-phosphate transaminase (isomerizing)